jgi:hypothetical protein
MNTQEYHRLQAEQTALASLLHELPTSSVIERLGLESQKEEIDEALASQVAPSREPAHARLTFRGKPIVGSHGVFAEFGAAVVNAFADAVSAIGSSQAGPPLGARGAIRGHDDYQLLITGTALGSFGFELEEAPQNNDDELFAEPSSAVESAIEKAKAIMEASVGSDDELADAISELDPRALEALRAFLKTMVDQEAACTLDFKDRAFRFADAGQVRQSLNRLGQNNIDEENEQIDGTFQGVLPKRRAFEFKIAATEDIISGKVGATIRDASVINRFLDQPTTVSVHTTRVGHGRPRYVLLEFQARTDAASAG